MRKDKSLKKLFGSPYYIAPEVLANEYDEKCDVWSLGVIFYIILCGYPPFNGNNDEEIIEQVRQGSYKMEGQEWDIIS